MPLLTKPQITKQLSVLPNCNACGAAAKCRSPKLTWPGKQADIVFVVDGVEQDSPSGLQDSPYNRLDGLCKRVGIEMRDYALVPASACFGASEEAWRHCQPLMASELSRLRPRVIIPFGSKATQSVVGRFWQRPAELFDRWYGYQIPCQQLNAWICPVGSVAPQKGQMDISQMWAYRWLRDAVRLTGRPWDHGVPDIKDCVTVLTDPAKIQEFLGFAKNLPITSLDWETLGLKPENSSMRIWSAAIAYRDEDEIVSVAFPVFEDCHDALRAYLTGPGRIIAHNMKFEARWAKQKLGVFPANLYWDSMQAAHIENPMSGVTGLKFQAFARLGVPYFADEVEGYFNQTDSNTPNNIAASPLVPLLTYNGIDSAVELILASIQMKQADLIRQHFVPEKYLPSNLHSA